MFFYKTGEEVRAGDHVRFHAEPGKVEFVAEPDDKNPEKQWYIQEFGGGVMLLEPKYFGSVFLRSSAFTDHESNWEDLEFISRAE